ncbi:MAG: KH domain-containing protein, partial [Rickettsiaceae bacterium]|nr:KH domain-containing protein [Rickettsiaceae bacterium]
TREKLFLNLNQELPYHLTVETEKWEYISEKEVKIYQNIIVASESHKMIILGKNGSMIKKIGIDARKEISDSFDLEAHLFLFVKVREKWDEKSIYYENMGLKIQK